MKKYIAAFISLLLILSMFTTPALAGTPEEVDPPEGQEEITDDEFTDEDLEGVLTPDSPWYFFKSFIESIKMTFTFNADKKTELMGELAEERAKELLALELKFADGEISEKQLVILEGALDALIDLTERYVQRLEEEIPGEGEGTEPPEDENVNPDEGEGTEPPEDENVNPDEGEGTEPPEEENVNPDEGEGTEPPEEDDKEYADKYLRRIAHLQRVAKKAPKSAQKGLARAIANAHRQRARMMAKGKLKADLPYSLFVLEIESDTHKLLVELEQSEDGIKAEVEKGTQDRTIELRHSCALAYLLPIFEPLELKASLSQEQVITMLLNAFSWDKDYSDLKIMVEFIDGSIIEISTTEPENPEDETDPGEETDPEDETNPEESAEQEEDSAQPAPAYSKFEVKLKADKFQQQIKYEQKRKTQKAEVEVKQKGKDTVKLKDAAALKYLESIFDTLNIDASMPRQQIVEGLLQALKWDKAYDELEIKIVFADGTKIDLKDKGQSLKIDLPYTKFEVKIKYGSDKLVAKFEQKRDEVKGEVKTKVDGKQKEFKKSSGLDYLLPILEALDINASMSQEELNSKILAAFGWAGDYDELEVKITFTDKTKIEYKSKGTPIATAWPFTQFELEIESAGKELSVELEGAKAEVEIEQKGSKDIELKGKKAIDYLLPILENLNINASMSQEAIIEKVLAAFAWEGKYEEFELYVIFPDGSKIKFEVELDD